MTLVSPGTVQTRALDWRCIPLVQKQQRGWSMQSPLADEA